MNTVGFMGGPATPMGAIWMQCVRQKLEEGGGWRVFPEKLLGRKKKRYCTVR